MTGKKLKIKQNPWINEKKIISHNFYNFFTNK